MSKQKIIALTGTPGTGKTNIAKILKKKGFAVIDLNLEIRKRRLYFVYDRKRKTYVADMKKIGNFLRKKLRSEKYESKVVIIDSHLSHLLPTSLINAVVVLRCSPEVLEKRLKERGWSAEKIRENVESEIIGLIEYEARERHKKVFAIDATKLKAGQIVNKIINLFKP